MTLTYKFSLFSAATTLVLFLGGCSRTRPTLRMKPLTPLTDETAHVTIKNHAKKATLRFKQFDDAEWNATCPRSLRPHADLPGLIVPVHVSLENNSTMPAHFIMEQQPYTPYTYNQVVTLIDKRWNPAGPCFLAAATIGGLCAIEAVTYEGLLGSIHSASDVLALSGVILISPLYGVTIGALFTLPLFPIILLGTVIAGNVVHTQQYPSSVAENIITTELTALPNQTVDGLMFLEAGNSASTLNLLQKSVIA